MKIRQIYFVYLFSLILSANLIAACSTTFESESRLYKQVFQDEKGMFRGISLGDKLKNIQEQKKPLYEDILGAVYDIPLSANENMRIHYYIDNLHTNKETNRIATIQADIAIADEIETTRLYNEIQQRLTQKYGLPMGNYGALKWENMAYSMEISLQIANNRKQLFLAFVSIK